MKVFRFLNKCLEELIVIICLGGMTISIGAQVFMRYIAKSSLAWSEELARFLFMFFIYAAISYGVQKHAHIKVEAFTTWLPKRGQAIIRIVSDILFLIFAIFVVYQGSLLADRTFKLGQISPALGFKMGYLYSSVPIGYALVAFRLLQNLHHSISNFVTAREEAPQL